MIIDHLVLRVRQHQDGLRRHARSPSERRSRRAANAVAHAIQSMSRRTSRETINREFLEAVAHGGAGLTHRDVSDARILLRTYRSR